MATIPIVFGLAIILAKTLVVGLETFVLQLVVLLN